MTIFHAQCKHIVRRLTRPQQSRRTKISPPAPPEFLAARAACVEKWAVILTLEKRQALAQNTHLVGFRRRFQTMCLRA
jgi:hypothetical protein